MSETPRDAWIVTLGLDACRCKVCTGEAPEQLPIEEKLREATC